MAKITTTHAHHSICLLHSWNSWVGAHFAGNTFFHSRVHQATSSYYIANISHIKGNSGSDGTRVCVGNGVKLNVITDKLASKRGNPTRLARRPPLRMGRSHADMENTGLPRWQLPRHPKASLNVHSIELHLHTIYIPLYIINLVTRQKGKARQTSHILLWRDNINSPLYYMVIVNNNNS